MDQKVLEAIKRSGAVPSMPQVVTRFMEIVQEPNFQYDDLVTVLSTDPGTAAEILRLSNSALFGVSRKITSLKQAMTLLGPRRVRSLVLGGYMVEAVGNKNMGELDASYFWRRSVTAGVVAARLADKVCPKLREEAFMSALLADIGITILAQEMPEKYRAVVQKYAPHGEVNVAQQELDAVGVTHGEISAAVLEYWQLPNIICEAVSKHQLDLAAASEAIELARLISSADKISKLLCESPELERLGSRCQAAMEFVNLDLGVLVDMIEQIQEDVIELAGVLKLDIIPSSVYKLIAKAISDHLEGTKV